MAMKIILFFTFILAFVSLIVSQVKSPGPGNAPIHDPWNDDYHPNRLSGLSGKDMDMFVTIDESGQQHIRFTNLLEPPHNIDYLGRGYDLYEGNPKETAPGGDAGYRMPIFFIDTLEEQLVHDHRYIKPKNVDVSTRVSCSTHASSRAMSTSQEVQKSISKSQENISGFSVGVAVGPVSVDYSQNAMKSKGFEDLRSTLSTGEEVAIENEATCTIYQASINPLVLPDLHPEFQHSLESLGPYTGQTAENYQEFIRTYGTHVVTSVLMGSRYGKIYLMKKSSLTNTESRTDSKASSVDRGVTVGITQGDVGASVGALWGNGQEEIVTVQKENMLSEMSEDVKMYSVGAPYVHDIEEWAQSSVNAPSPVKIQLLPLDELVGLALGEERGRDVARALANYRPQGYTKPLLGFRKCYMARSEHITFDQKTEKKSLIAKCRPGFTVLGGTFEHLWNSNGDVHVDALASTQKKIMEDLGKFHNLRVQEEAVKYLLEHGSEMLKKFTDANIIDHIGDLFGERINPLNLQKFLLGKLQTLGIEKHDSLKGLTNGLLLFGKSKIGDLTTQFLGKNPYTEAIFGTGQSLHENGTYTEPNPGDGDPETTGVLSFNTPFAVDPFTIVDAKVAEKHADALAELFNAIDHKNGGKLYKTDEAQTEIFDLIKKAISHITDVTSKWWKDTVEPHLNDALKSWKDFSTKFDNIWKDEERLKQVRQSITSSPLFHDILGRVKENRDVHATTVLAERNSVNWLFPHADDEFVCGSGNLGLEATKRSSMGHCTALCCDAEGWDIETFKERRANVNMEERTSEVTAVCDSGLTLVSGGILLGDYEDGRFVQIVENRPDANNAWKCKVKWSEETYNAFAPRFRCYARCASSVVSKPVCQNIEQPLVNGHGTATCPPNTMAVSGGWNVKSNGITYMKKTEFTDVAEGQGAESFRCEFGSSHDGVVGNCVARCCDIQILDAEERLLQNAASCPHNWERMGRRDIGSTLRFNDEFHKYDALVSPNGKYFMTYDPSRTKLTVREVLDRCSDSHTIGELEFENNCAIYQQHAAPFIFGQWNFQYNIFGQSVKIFKPSNFAPTLYQSPTPTYPENSKVVVKANGLMVYDNDKRCGDREYTKAKLETVEMSDNGDLVFYDDNGEALFTHRFSMCRLMYRRLLMEKSRLESGELLLLNQGLVSPNKNNMLWFMPGGGLAVVHQHAIGYCREPNLLWTTAKLNGRLITEYAELYEFNNQLKEGWVLRLQADNNLVVYDDKSVVQWSSGTNDRGVGKATLFITDSGELELKDAVGVTLWNNRYGAIRSCQSLRERLKIRSHRLGAGSSIKPGVGGLVSKNGEYIVYIEEGSNGESHFEWWRSGGADCKPVRLCTIKKNVNQLDLKPQGLFANDQPIFQFPGNVPLEELVLQDNGELYAYGGHNHRREVAEYISAKWDCNGMRHK